MFCPDDYGLPIPFDSAKPEGRKKQITRQKSFHELKAAEVFRDKLNAAKHQPGGVVVPRDQLFAHAAEAWLASRTDLKARTHAEYTKLLTPYTRARKDADGNNTAHLSIIATFGGTIGARGGHALAVQRLRALGGVVGATRCRTRRSTSGRRRATHPRHQSQRGRSRVC